MKRKAVRRGMILYMAALLCGCRDSAEKNTAGAEHVEETEVSVVKEQTDISVWDTAMDISEEVLPEPEAEPETENMAVEVAEEEPVLYPVTDYDIPPSDTVRYVESDREEIFRTCYTESVIDENDPTTYQIIQKEEEVTVTEEFPTEYTDNSGNVKYTYSDGIWYEYKYSTGEIILGEPDEEAALFFLNLDGFYDGYEIQTVNCSELADESMGTQYAYHVLYYKSSAMEGEPEDVEGLKVGAVRSETSVTTRIVEEKVPVMVETEEGTGEYVYYGWQDMDGDIYYFDGNGEKVTGSHVIRGIHYTFDEDGIKISDNGIHVSERNGEIDWKRVKDAKIDYAVIRGAYRGCGKGELVRDSRFEENVAGARHAGIDVGLSVYSQAVTEEEAVEEARLALRMAEEDQITRPLVVVSSYGDPEYKGRADGLSAADRTAYVNTFCETVKNAGYTPMVCAEKSWLEHCLDADMLGPYPVCIAQYNSNVTYTGDYDVWQYTARGNIDGISGNIGLSISRR